MVVVNDHVILIKSRNMKIISLPWFVVSFALLGVYSPALKADPLESSGPGAAAAGLTAPPGVVAWWPGDGDARDLAGSNHGTGKGKVEYLPGIVSQAFAFSGGDYVEIPDSPDLRFGGTNAMTVELWAYRTGHGAGMQLINKRSGARDATFQLAFHPGEGLAFGGLASTGDAARVTTDIPLPLNQWWHLAGVCDGAQLRFYINGILVASAPGRLAAANAAPVRIGAMEGDTPEFFEGLIDEVTLYRRALAAEEILAIYQAGTNGKTKPPAPIIGTPVIPPPGLVSWWAADGSPSDAVGSNDGVLRGGATFAPGLVGEAFALRNGAYIEVPGSASLHFTGTNAMTVELWACRTGTGNLMHLLTKRIRELDAEYQIAFDPIIGLSFGSVTSTPWNSSAVATGIQMPLNQWWHLAGTFDGAQLRFYINGKLASSAPGRLGTSNAEPLRIGTIDFNSPYDAFEGLLDEVSIYRRALGPEEIQAIYQAGAAGKTKAITILEGPQSRVGYWGKTAVFDVVVKGAGVFTYQWLKDGTALPGATGATLLLRDLQLSDAGAYTVVVTGPGGSAVSVPAQLKVNPAGVSLGLYAGLLIEGVAGKSYAIQYTPALSLTNTWITLTNLTLAQPVQLWLDTTTDTRSPGLPGRIYQVVPAP